MTHRRIDDATAEALLTGRPTPAGDEVLMAFFEVLRASANGPVPAPSVALASVLDGGLVTEKGDLPATAASNVTGPAPQTAGLPKWRRKRMIISTLLAGLSLPAKAFVGVSMAAASIGGAAAAGVPAAQDVVSAVTPVEFHENSNDNADFGEDVSTDARDGGVDGKEISEKAKAQAEERRQDGEHPSGAPTAPGSTGLDQANTTPGTEHAPDSVSATPAAGADNKPADTPAETPAGPPSETPASTAPVSTPAGPPAESPASAPAGVPVDRP
jgi:hypothetical protein